MALPAVAPATLVKTAVAGSVGVRPAAPRPPETGAGVRIGFVGTRGPGRAEGAGYRADEFTALAERVSREDLDAFFTAWLFTPEKPELEEVAAATADATATELALVPRRISR